jgi:hypothetical protein
VHLLREGVCDILESRPLLFMLEPILRVAPLHTKEAMLRLLVVIDRRFEVRYAGLWAPDLRPTSLLEGLVTYDKVVLIHRRPQLLG